MSCGRLFDQENMSFFSILISIILLVGLVWIFNKVYVPKQDAWIFWIGLGLKILSGFGVAWLYTYYYNFPTADTFRFHKGVVDFTRVIFENSENALDIFLHTSHYENLFQAKELARSPRVGFFIKILFFINLLSNDNYWILSAWLSMLSFLGGTFLTLKIQSVLPNQRTIIRTSLVFIPTCFFWTSGLLKDSLTWGIICVLIGIFIDIKDTTKQLHWYAYGTFGFLFYLLLELKYYYFGALATAFIIAYIVPQNLSKRKFARTTFIFSSLLLIGLIILIDSYVPQLSFQYFLESLVENHDITVAQSKRSIYSGDFIQFHNLQPTIWSIIQNAPLAIISSLFRPFIWEAHGILQWLVAIQNFLVLIFFVPQFFHFIKNHRNVFSTQFLWAFIGTSSFVLITSVLLAIASPNFGALERYKAVFYPFFVLIILYKNPLLEKISRTFFQSTKKI
jgi:hypothetical protein